MKSFKQFFLFLVLGLSPILSAQHQGYANLLQNIDARQKTSLNGMWDMIVDPLESGYYNHRLKERGNGYFINAQMKSPSDLIEYDFSTSQQLMVPGDWNTQTDKLYYYEGTVWYKKDFNHTAKADELAFLYFEAVNYEAIVYLNGEKVGKHVGGYTPFQFEVTDKLKEGNNFVVVKVDNKRKAENVPMIMSEVGGGALFGRHGKANERWTEEYQTEVYRTNIEMMRNIDFLAGLSPWILMDFRSARRPLRRIQDDFNRKGLISEQGMKKQAFFVLRDYYLNENN